MQRSTKIILAFFTTTIALVAGTMYLLQSVQYRFEASSVLLGALILEALFLLLLRTYFLYESGRKETIIKVWLLVTSISMTYIIADLISGYFLIETHSPRTIPDEYRHHKLQPKTQLNFATREYNYIQKINNLGLRGGDIQVNKPRNQYRIIMLGDSFTMGKGVEDDKTFSALLEKDLNKKFIIHNNRIIEVLNAGVVSYSPILSFFQLTKEVGSLSPDLVVLNLDMSDLMQEMAYRNMATYGDDGQIIGVDGYKDKKPVAARVRRWINRNLYITRLFFFYLEKFSGEVIVENVVSQADPELLRHTLAHDSVQRKEQWQDVFDSILKIKRYCDDSGIKFLLTTYPWGHQVSKNEWRPGRFALVPENAVVSDRSIKTIEEFSMNNSIDLLNVFPVFRRYNGKSPLYYSYDIHWTSAGHKLMAEELERYIRSTYLKTDVNVSRLEGAFFNNF